MTAVVFQFSAMGQDSILKAFSSVEKGAAKAGRSMATHLNKEAVLAEKAAMRAAKAQEKSALQVAKGKIKSEEQATKSLQRELAKQTKDYQAEMTKRAKIARTLIERETKAAQRKAKKKAESGSSFWDDAGISMPTPGGAVATVGKVIGAAILSAAAIAATTIGAATREGLQDRAQATRIAIDGGVRDQGANVQERANQVAINNAGHTTSEELAGLGAFHAKTGDLQGGLASLDAFTKAADASGASLEDIASLAGDLRNNLKIDDPKELNETLANLISQGRDGTFELKDMAANFAKAGAAAAAFNVDEFKGKAGATKLGGLLQLARQSTGSGEAATTSVEAMFSALNSHGKKLSVAGVKVRDKQGHKRDTNDIIIDSLNAGGANFTKKDEVLSKVFGEQGIRALNPLRTTFESTYNTAKTGGSTDKDALAKASEAVRKQLESAESATGAWEAMMKDAATVQASASNQLVGSWERLKSAVEGSGLLDQIQELGIQLAGLANGAMPDVQMGLSLLGDGASVALDALQIFGEGMLGMLKGLFGVFGPLLGDKVKMPGEDIWDRAQQNFKKGKEARAARAEVTQANSDLEAAKRTNDPQQIKTATERLRKTKEYAESLQTDYEHTRDRNSDINKRDVRDGLLNVGANILGGVGAGAIVSSMTDSATTEAKNNAVTQKQQLEDSGNVGSAKAAKEAAEQNAASAKALADAASQAKIFGDLLASMGRNAPLVGRTP